MKNWAFILEVKYAQVKSVIMKRIFDFEKKLFPSRSQFQLFTISDSERVWDVSVEEMYSAWVLKIHRREAEAEDISYTYNEYDSNIAAPALQCATTSSKFTLTNQPIHFQYSSTNQLLSRTDRDTDRLEELCSTVHLTTNEHQRPAI